MIALDYCHKIKCYFNGITEEDVKDSLVREFEGVSTRLREIGKLYEAFWSFKKSFGGSSKSHSRSDLIDIDKIRERALEISRTSEGVSGNLNEEKRLCTVLLRDVETFIATLQS